jgi:hypothetical protein
MNRKVLAIVTLSLQFFAYSASAALGTKYQTDFTMNPGGPHRAAAISGVITLSSTDGQTFSEAVVTPSAPVFGKNEFRSEVIKTISMSAGTTDKLGVILKLKGAPHRWYFVVMFSSIDGGLTYDGKLYKGSEDLADLEAKLAAGAGLPVASWKALGDLVLKKQ